MILGKVKIYSKFKAYLIAYKDVSESIKEQIYQNSILLINEPVSITKDNQKDSCGMNTRIDIYLDVFQDDIDNGLTKGYQFAIVELRKSNKVFPELSVKELIDKESNVFIFGTYEL